MAKATHAPEASDNGPAPKRARTDPDNDHGLADTVPRDGLSEQRKSNGKAERPMIPRRSGRDVGHENGDGGNEHRDGNGSENATTMAEHVADEDEGSCNPKEQKLSDVSNRDQIAQHNDGKDKNGHDRDRESEDATTVADEPTDEDEDSGDPKQPTLSDALRKGGIHGTGNGGDDNGRAGEDLGDHSSTAEVANTAETNQNTSALPSPTVENSGESPPAAMIYFLAKKSSRKEGYLDMSRTSDAMANGIEKWRNLPRLQIVHHKGEEYRPNEIVYIYTQGQSWESLGDPAIILDIRDTEVGRERSDIFVAWLCDEETANKKDESEKWSDIWEKGVTHLITNHYEVLPWDTLNGHAERKHVRVDMQHYLDLHSARFLLQPILELGKTVN